MENLLGRKIKDRYRVDTLIGRGGMAEVYKVWDEERADALAMKVLREDLAQDKIFLRRFEREAQTLAKLQHRSIVRFYGLEQDDLLVFLLMEYIEGTSLREEIFRVKEPFTSQRILEVLRPVCAAMHYAHRMGIVHCDLKPGNILIDHHGELLVTDFGIARMIDASTATMVGLGTPAYMAPELVKGQDPTPQTDIYALGVILYEMFTGGERPFTGERAETTGSTAEKIRWEQMKLAPKPLTDYNPEISPAMQGIVIRCLAKIPDQRYEDMQVVYEEAEIALNHRSGSIKMTEPKAEPVKEQAHEFHSVEKEEVNENLQIPKQNIERVKRNSSSRKKKTVPLFTHLDTQEGNIYDFDLYNEKIVISAEKVITVSNLINRKKTNSILIKSFYDQVRFYPNKKLILIRTLNDISFVSIENGKICRKIENSTTYTINDFEISSDGNYCAALLNNDLVIRWDLNQKTRNERLSGFIFAGHLANIKIVPNSDFLIEATDLCFLRILSLPSLEIVDSITENVISGVEGIVCSPSGNVFALWNDFSSIQVFDTINLENIANIGMITDSINTAAFLHDENLILTIDKSGNFSTLDLKTSNIINIYNSEIIGITKVLISDDGQYMVTLCKGKRLDYWKLNGQGGFS